MYKNVNTNLFYHPRPTLPILLELIVFPEKGQKPKQIKTKKIFQSRLFDKFNFHFFPTYMNCKYTIIHWDVSFSTYFRSIVSEIYHNIRRNVSITQIEVRNKI